MVRENEIRRGEIAIDLPPPEDAGLVFIGVIRTPWSSRLTTPRMGRSDGPVCRIEVFEPWREALDGVEKFERLEVLYWLHLSRRDLVRQSPANDGSTRGTFALRTPARPNPIGTTIATLVGRRHDVAGARHGLPRRHAASRHKADRTCSSPSRRRSPVITNGIGRAKPFYTAIGPDIGVGDIASSGNPQTEGKTDPPLRIDPHPRQRFRVRESCSRACSKWLA